jgi:catechol 2,3-dioxygenase-like lactoylglutathione lyase family enzyme
MGVQLGEAPGEHSVELILRAVLDGIDHVQLAAPPGCEPEARRFFGELLGLEELEKPESLQARGGVWFRAGAQQVHVGVEDPFEPARKAHPAFAVSRYDELLERLRGGGVAVTEDDAIPGVRRSYVADPWENRIELVAVENGDATLRA